MRKSIQSHVSSPADTVFEIFLYVEGSDPYDHPGAPITNLRVAQEAVKRAGCRFRIKGNPEKEQDHKTRNKDAFRR